MSLSLMEGNEAIARAAVAAGCRFFAGYPITPATTIYQHMLDLLPPCGGICLQGEDEIASLGFCLGASMAGMKAMTATSGPGISLCSEQISFAIGSEIPVVIVDVQRLGPSTGSATRGADGDIQFLRWGNSGGLPVIVLAPVDVRDCFVLTAQAFNLAEQFRCPVFVATNKEIAMTRESLDMDALVLPDPVDRSPCPPDRDFLPFAPAPDRPVPDFLPIGGNRIVRQTSSTHGPDGYLTADPRVIARTLFRLRGKLNDAVDGFAFHAMEMSEGADTLLIVYGVTARAARTALAYLHNRGRKISLLILKTLYPVPENLIKSCLQGHRQVVVIEMNLGQYAREIQRLAGGIPVRPVGQMNGELITPQQVVEATNV
jgi:2-oxoglutarate/2-oxoacid ferredoxin oxidoreductase subunit alpha